ncbi:hypothetical protein [Streptomyces canus]|uniref:kynureninase/PvdN C-terminal domain-containing protein n=1 Tax=Streptomyces canus TaxID=58343 RepID=UPI0036EDCDD7
MRALTRAAHDGRRRPGRGPGGRLRLHVPLRRPRSSRLPLRRPTPPHHFGDPVAGLDRLRRSLRPGRLLHARPRPRPHRHTAGPVPARPGSGPHTPGPSGLHPRHPGRRGSQVTLRHAHAHARGLAVALAEGGAIADMRAPDLLRSGGNALCTSHQDMLTAAVRLRDLTEEAAYDPAPPTTGPVT